LTVVRQYWSRNPSWSNDPIRSTITMHHLLTMQPGLDWREEYVDGGSSDVIPMLNDVADMAKFAASKPAVCKPGTLFNYSSGTTNIVCDILTCALCCDGQGRRSGAERKAAFLLFFNQFATGLLQCSFAAPKFDKAGTFVGSSWLYASARDFARLAHLYLHDGVWGGVRILPEGWAAYASQWSGEADDGRGYGAQFWLDTFAGGGGNGPRTYSCNGYEGQFTIAVPDHDLIVVRLGKSKDDGSQKENLISGLTGMVAELVEQAANATTRARL
jgi:CubicO group peptidase (beta-lactamase class C family)